MRTSRGLSKWDEDLSEYMGDSGRVRWKNAERLSEQITADEEA